MLRRLNTIARSFRRAYCDKKSPRVYVVEERFASSQEEYFRRQTPRQLEQLLIDFKLEQEAKVKEKEEQIKAIEEKVKMKLKASDACVKKNDKKCP